MNNPRLKFAHYLRDARVKAGLSQEKLAKSLGYGCSQYVSNWERGLCMPPLASLKKIVVLCKLSKDEVFAQLIELEREELSQKLQQALFRKN